MIQPMAHDAAAQVISLLKDAFQRAGLGLYLRPYGCLPTGYECGIIEVVPNTKSRAALGELSDRGLYDIFSSEFGAPGSSAFEKARTNFIVSEAAYAVASFLLQVWVMSQPLRQVQLLLGRGFMFVHQLSIDCVSQQDWGARSGYKIRPDQLTQYYKLCRVNIR
jgi:hypothetical protein